MPRISAIVSAACLRVLRLVPQSAEPNVEGLSREMGAERVEDEVRGLAGIVQSCQLTAEDR